MWDRPQDLIVMNSIHRSHVNTPHVFLLLWHRGAVQWPRGSEQKRQIKRSDAERKKQGDEGRDWTLRFNCAIYQTNVRLELQFQGASSRLPYSNNVILFTLSAELNTYVPYDRSVADWSVSTCCCWCCFFFWRCRSSSSEKHRRTILGLWPIQRVQIICWKRQQPPIGHVLYKHKLNI